MIRAASSPRFGLLPLAPRAIARLAGLLAAFAGPTVAPAQTPVTSLGLGYPVAPLDARAAALGGTGVGLMGASLSFRNPADLVEFRSPILGFTAVPEDVDVRRAGGEEPTGRSRFSLLRGVVPLGRWAFSIGFGSELDQDWSVRFLDTLDSSIGRFPFVESREHDGGISFVDVSLARQFGPISLGGSYERLSGTQRQAFERRFEPDLEAGLIIGNVDEATVWSFTSWRLRGGLGIAVGRWLRLGGAFTWTSDLQAERRDPDEVRRFSLPTAFEVGLSLRPTERLLLAAGGGWANWSTTAGRLGDDGAEDTLWGGGGIEYTGVRLGRSVVPLRVGARFTDLPFFPRGAAQLSETAFGFGTGIGVAGGRAVLDLAVEFGSRGDLADSGVEEGFRRFAISFAVRQ